MFVLRIDITFFSSLEFLPNSKTICLWETLSYLKEKKDPDLAKMPRLNHLLLAYVINWKNLHITEVCGL